MGSVALGVAEVGSVVEGCDCCCSCWRMVRCRCCGVADVGVGADFSDGTDDIDNTDCIDGADLIEGADGAALIEGAGGLDLIDGTDGAALIEGADGLDLIEDTCGVDFIDCMDFSDGTGTADDLDEEDDDEIGCGEVTTIGDSSDGVGCGWCSGSDSGVSCG